MKDRYMLSSAAVQEKLLNASNIEDFYKENEDNMLEASLSEYLTDQLYKKNLTVTDVVKDSGEQKAYVHQIIYGKRKNPSRNKLIAIAFGLHLNAEETQRMLKLGGCSELYARKGREAMILFCINKGLSIFETDDMLYENGFDTILPSKE